MISDVLFDAVVEIERYQSEFPDSYGPWANRIDRVRMAMQTLQRALDAPPTVCPDGEPDGADDAAEVLGRYGLSGAAGGINLLRLFLTSEQAVAALTAHITDCGMTPRFAEFLEGDLGPPPGGRKCAAHDETAGDRCALCVPDVSPETTSAATWAGVAPDAAEQDLCQQEPERRRPDERS